MDTDFQSIMNSSLQQNRKTVAEKVPKTLYLTSTVKLKDRHKLCIDKGDKGSAYDVK